MAIVPDLAGLDRFWAPRPAGVAFDRGLLLRSRSSRDPARGHGSRHRHGLDRRDHLGVAMALYSPHGVGQNPARDELERYRREPGTAPGALCLAVLGTP